MSSTLFYRSTDLNLPHLSSHHCKHKNDATFCEEYNNKYPSTTRHTVLKARVYSFDYEFSERNHPSLNHLNATKGAAAQDQHGAENSTCWLRISFQEIVYKNEVKTKRFEHNREVSCLNCTIWNLKPQCDTERWTKHKAKNSDSVLCFEYICMVELKDVQT